VLNNMGRRSPFTVGGGDSCASVNSDQRMSYGLRGGDLGRCVRCASIRSKNSYE
jgi:hypothetical protein